MGVLVTLSFLQGWRGKGGAGRGTGKAGDALAHVITQLEQLSIHIGEAYEIKGGRR